MAGGTSEPALTSMCSDGVITVTLPHVAGTRGKENPSPVEERVVVVRGGLEPPTFRFSGGRSTS